MCVLQACSVCSIFKEKETAVIPEFNILSTDTLNPENQSIATTHITQSTDLTSHATGKKCDLEILQTNIFRKTLIWF